MDAYETTNWSGLFGSEVAASAALTGLIFVAASINLKAILEYAALPRRTLKALAIMGAVAVFGSAWIDVSVWRTTQPEYRRGVRPVVLILISAASGLATAIAGVSLVAHAGGGLYWLVPAVLLAFLSSLIDAWVLLIEIVR